MKTWAAFYDGRCTNCGHTFQKGTTVKWEGGHVVEEVCMDHPAEEVGMGPNEVRVYRESMCLRCFTVHGPGQQECT